MLMFWIYPLNSLFVSVVELRVRISAPFFLVVCLVYLFCLFYVSLLSSFFVLSLNVFLVLSFCRRFFHSFLWNFRFVLVSFMSLRCFVSSIF
jgi:hypothetical protein